MSPPPRHKSNVPRWKIMSFHPEITTYKASQKQHQSAACARLQVIQGEVEAMQDCMVSCCDARSTLNGNKQLLYGKY